MDRVQHRKKESGELCMAGNIYCRQRCEVCGEKLEHDESRGGFFCPNHPKIQATGGFYLKFPGGVRFANRDYEIVRRKLNTMRYEMDQGTFDPRKHRSDNPLSFRKLAMLYIEERKADPISDNMKRQVEHQLGLAMEEWGDLTVKDIGRRHIKHFIRSLDVADKTKANYQSTLHRFFAKWLVEEEYLEPHEVPAFPEVKYELGWRKITDLATQNEILDKLREMTAHNPKIWFGVELLRTYPTMRPGDLHRMQEGHIDTAAGTIIMPTPTKTKGGRKIVRLIDEHIGVFEEFKRRHPGIGSAPFFRHCASGTNYRENQPMGENCFRRWWHKACRAVGVEGLQLYGGTKHTTTTETAKAFGREAAKGATGHANDKAFNRYCQTEGEDALRIHQQMATRRKSLQKDPERR